MEVLVLEKYWLSCFLTVSEGDVESVVAHLLIESWIQFDILNWIFFIIDIHKQFETNQLNLRLKLFLRIIPCYHELFHIKDPKLLAMHQDNPVLCVDFVPSLFKFWYRTETYMLFLLVFRFQIPLICDFDSLFAVYFICFQVDHTYVKS